MYECHLPVTGNQLEVRGVLNAGSGHSRGRRDDHGSVLHMLWQFFRRSACILYEFIVKVERRWGDPGVEGNNGVFGHGRLTT